MLKLDLVWLQHAWLSFGPICSDYNYSLVLQGGGVKRLFRKVDNKSSCYDPHHPGTVRRDGSYIYEEFLATGGTDVKVCGAFSG
jgi:hypothetical protein